MTGEFLRASMRSTLPSLALRLAAWRLRLRAGAPHRELAALAGVRDGRLVGARGVVRLGDGDGVSSVITGARGAYRRIDSESLGTPARFSKGARPTHQVTHEHATDFDLVDAAGVSVRVRVERFLAVIAPPAELAPPPPGFDLRALPLPPSLRETQAGAGLDVVRIGERIAGDGAQLTAWGVVDTPFDPSAGHRQIGQAPPRRELRAPKSGSLLLLFESF